MTFASEYDLTLVWNRIIDLERRADELDENFQALRNVLDAIRVMVEERNGDR